MADKFGGEIAIIGKYGLPANDLLDLLLYGNEKTLIKNFDYGKRVFRNDAEKPFKNIICIQVEALGSNIIHCKYKEKHVTPFLHRLSSRSIYYPYMLMYSGEGKTSDVEFACMNSLIPLNNFHSMKLRSYSYPNSFVKELSKSGFESTAFHNNKKFFFNRNISFSKMGFRKFYDIEEMKLKEKGWGAADHDVIGYVKNKLKGQKLPFLYYIITMSSHYDYRNIRQYYLNERYEDMDNELIKNYFNSMSYVDKVLEDFILFVKNNFEGTYIFIYGDYPPYMRENSFLKSAIVEHDNQYLKYTPLFIITPDNKKYTEDKKIVSILDLSPTVLYASGVSFEIKTSGVNLLDFPIKEGLIPIRDNEMLDRRSIPAGTQKENKIKLPEFIAHAGGGIDNLSGTNSLEALNASYEKGFRFIELDFNWTTDNHLVLIHDWEESANTLFSVYPKAYSLNEFRKFKMVKNLTQMTLDDLANWLDTHPDVFIITDIKQNNIGGLRHISRKYPRICPQLIPQVYQFAEHNAVRKLGFDNAILTLYRENYSDDTLLEFVQKHPVLAITIPTGRALTDLPFKLKDMGVFVYTHTVNLKKIRDKLKANGVDGFYTDSFEPRT